MGKKGKDKKKGKGAEKTAVKMEKKQANKQKKELAAIGEENIENIIAEIEKEEKRRQRVTEAAIVAPSRRVNFTLAPHPDKDELLLFGGEFYNGQKTFVYNDLFIYNIPHNQWIAVKAPGCPPPRCGHQMVSVSSGKGQLWVFGGEFASETQSQFYHYRDLWVYHLSAKKWEKITAAGGPSARSGHRMVHSKKQLFVFGGFHDNLRDYKYFNDLYAFNLETYTWSKLEPSGTAPAPRSGCNMVSLNDGRILVFGGYSKERIKKDVDKGHVHTDMHLLTPDKNDTTGTKFKWQPVKQHGIHFSPRCSMTTTFAPNNTAYTFGGVFDMEEDEENINGIFYNDLHCLDLEKISWRQITLSGKKDKTKKRRKENKDGDEVEEEDEMEVEEEEKVVADDGIFTVTVGPSLKSTSQVTNVCNETKLFQPSPRMNCGLAVKKGTLYLYGGMFEEGSKQLTYCDFYSLDLHKLEEWKTIQEDSVLTQEWLGSDSESEESEGSESGSEEEESEDEDEEEMEESPMETT